MQVKAFGPGLEPTGIIVNKSTQFTVDAREAGKGSLKTYAQVYYVYYSQCFALAMIVD